MKIHPFLVPHILNMPPYIIENIKSGYSLRDVELPFYGRSTISQNECLHIESIGGRHLGSKIVYDDNFSDKHKSALLGKSVDILIDIPLSHRSEMIAYEEHLIYKPKDDTLSWEEAPVHTNKSYNARMNRMGFEILFYSNIHWITEKILNELTVEEVASLDLIAVPYERSVELGPDVFKGHDFIENCIIEVGKGSPTIKMKTGHNITNSVLYLDGVLPESYRSALVDESARKLVDHSFFDDVLIRTVKPKTNKTMIGLKDKDSIKSYARKYPDKTNQILKIVREKEAEASSENVKSWDAAIKEMDRGRSNNPQDYFSSRHLFYNIKGKARERKNDINPWE